MRSILFNVRPGVAEEERELLLKHLGQIDGILKVAALRSGAKNAAVQRMYYAQVTDETDIDSLRAQIAALPNVESADLPSERGLV
jgi:hypothetical protein